MRIRMLVASAALGALMLGAYFLVPVAQLHYHAWRYKTGRDSSGSSLKWVADFAVKNRMQRAEIMQVLGEDCGNRPHYLRYRLNPCPLSSMPIVGYFILLKDGKASEVQVWPGAGIPIGG